MRGFAVAVSPPRVTLEWTLSLVPGSCPKWPSSGQEFWRAFPASQGPWRAAPTIWAPLQAAWTPTSWTVSNILG